MKFTRALVVAVCYFTIGTGLYVAYYTVFVLK